MNEIINIDSVDVYNKQFGLETLHPLVSVIDMNQATLKSATIIQYTIKGRFMSR